MGPTGGRWQQPYWDKGAMDLWGLATAGQLLYSGSVAAVWRQQVCGVPREQKEAGLYKGETEFQNEE